MTAPQAAAEPQRTDPAPRAAAETGAAASSPTGAAPATEHAPAARGPEDTQPLRLRRDAGLPRRTRGRTMAAAHPAGTPQPEGRSTERSFTPAESAARFGAFRRAVQGQDPAAPPSPASPDPEADAR
ncbi:hypothetical protein [Streptomyces otsuchiensis]|uniref:hypothetical protein n=1 Tax=Streptomyces otsuchiensis TaxID=2681388 RepID=UPI001031EDC7|nr:hypothetical protein [Streptomyces otsuchiensis]